MKRTRTPPSRVRRCDRSNRRRTPCRVFEDLRGCWRPAGRHLDHLHAALFELGLLDGGIDVFRLWRKRDVAGCVLGMEMRRGDVDLGILAGFDFSQHCIAVPAAEPGVDDERRPRADDDANVGTRLTLSSGIT